jgi:hypothetical protein
VGPLRRRVHEADRQVVSRARAGTRDYTQCDRMPHNGRCLRIATQLQLGSVISLCMGIRPAFNFLDATRSLVSPGRPRLCCRPVLQGFTYVRFERWSRELVTHRSAAFAVRHIHVLHCHSWLSSWSLA